MKPATRPSVFVPEIVSIEGTSPQVTSSIERGEADGMFRTSLYLSRAVHDKLREIAFHERRKVHDLFMDGIDKVLAERGYPCAEALRNSTKAL